MGVYSSEPSEQERVYVYVCVRKIATCTSIEDKKQRVRYLQFLPPQRVSSLYLGLTSISDLELEGASFLWYTCCTVRHIDATQGRALGKVFLAADLLVEMKFI